MLIVSVYRKNFIFFFFVTNVISILGLKVGYKVTGGGRLGLFGSSFKLASFCLNSMVETDTNVILFQ